MTKKQTREALTGLNWNMSSEPCSYCGDQEPNKDNYEIIDNGTYCIQCIRACNYI